MKRRPVVATLLALSGFPAAVLAADDDTSAARAAAGDWLKKLDLADAAGTWESAASAFKASVTAPAWQQAAQSLQAQYGALRSRTEKSATFARSLPGAPEGRYVILQFDAVFEKKARSVETVTVALDRDGAWHVAGYFVN